METISIPKELVAVVEFLLSVHRQQLQGTVAMEFRDGMVGMAHTPQLLITDAFMERDFL